MSLFDLYRKMTPCEDKFHVILLSSGALVDTYARRVFERTVSSGFEMVVSGGCNAGSTTVLSGGSLTVSSAGELCSTHVSGGLLTVSNGGRAIGTVVSSGMLQVLSGGIESSPTIIRGSVGIAGSVSNLKAICGRAEASPPAEIVLSSGANVSGAIFSGGVSGTVMDGAIVRDLRISSNYFFPSESILTSSGTDIITIPNYINRTTILSGGVASGVTICDGYMTISSGGSALEVSSQKGCITVESGGVITYVENSDSGTVLTN